MMPQVFRRSSTHERFLAIALFALFATACGDSSGNGGGPEGGGGSDTGGGGSGSGGSPDGGQCEADEPGTEANATEPGFSETPTCDPIGTWSLSFDAEQEQSLSPSAMTILRDGEDRLVVESTHIDTATISADGCTIEIHWFYDDGGELIDDQCFECDSYLDATLTLTAGSDEASGPTDYEDIGECDLQQAGTVTATRSSR